MSVPSRIDSEVIWLFLPLSTVATSVSAFDFIALTLKNRQANMATITVKSITTIHPTAISVVGVALRAASIISVGTISSGSEVTSDSVEFSVVGLLGSVKSGVVGLLGSMISGVVGLLGSVKTGVVGLLGSMISGVIGLLSSILTMKITCKCETTS